MIKKIQSLFLSFTLIITSFIGLGQVATVAVALAAPPLRADHQASHLGGRRCAIAGPQFASGAPR